MDVKTDSTPANRAALPTYIQFTSSMAAATPTVAIAVCATVFTALIAAAFAPLLLLFKRKKDEEEDEEKEQAVQ